MLNQIRASIAKAIAPRVSLPVIGTELPQVQLLNQPITPSASAPGDLVRSNPAELNSLIRAIHGVSTAMKAGRPAAALPGRAAPARPAPRAAAPAPSNDDDEPVSTVPNDGLSSVIDTLTKSVQDLKRLLGLTDDSEDEQQAKAALARGNRKEALACISRAHSDLGAKLATRNKSNALRFQPSSRKRASALIRQGFDAQPVVANLDAMFHRPAARASLALAPVGGSAPAPSSSRSDRFDKIRAIQAQMKAIDLEQKKQFSNARHDEHLKLKAQLQSLRLK